MTTSFGLVGYPLGHSLSPRLHRLIYEETGYDGAYNLFQVEAEELEGVVPALRTLGIRGANVTLPHKQAIMPYLDQISPEAKQIGAVNTIDMTPSGAACGTNTDYYGFQMQLARSGIGITGKRFLICGMSGAGKAVRQALEDGGASEILVASTDPRKGISYDSLHTLPHMDAIVNCTSLGMHPKVEASVVGPDILSKFDAAVDVVYIPKETKFLRQARSCGLKTSGGLYMLVYQGIRAFTLWTGIEVGEEGADRIYQRLQQHLDMQEQNQA